MTREGRMKTDNAIKISKDFQNISCMNSSNKIGVCHLNSSISKPTNEKIEI